MSPATPPPPADERELLLGSLAQARYLLTLTAYGLTDEQAHATPPSGGGLLRITHDRSSSPVGVIDR